VRIVRDPAPGPEAEVGEPLDLLVRLHQLGEPADDYAPSGMGRRVIAVRLEPDEVLVADRGQLRPGAGAEDHILPVHQVVDRQDHDLAVGEEADPPHRNRAEQPQAVRERQYLQASVICGMHHHNALPNKESLTPLPSASALAGHTARSPAGPGNKSSRAPATFPEPGGLWKRPRTFGKFLVNAC